MPPPHPFFSLILQILTGQPWRPGTAPSPGTKHPLLDVILTEFIGRREEELKFTKDHNVSQCEQWKQSGVRKEEITSHWKLKRKRVVIVCEGRPEGQQRGVVCKAEEEGTL